MNAEKLADMGTDGAQAIASEPREPEAASLHPDGFDSDAMIEVWSEYEGWAAAAALDLEIERFNHVSPDGVTLSQDGLEIEPTAADCDVESLEALFDKVFNNEIGFFAANVRDAWDAWDPKEYVDEAPGQPTGAAVEAGEATG
jgi:hypothetical protein